MVHRRHPAHPALLPPDRLAAAWGTSPEVLPPVECAYDPELHTGPRDVIESVEQRAAREDVAREVCAACPARAWCGQYAATMRPTFGVWAGRTAREIALDTRTHAVTIAS
ncbi:WhiB family transcriptional regulator [Nonomuraea sp. NPDC050786]|uniref:WhiB family transcriptional regulator n=1 Tax=Nonomuraea sp. NPDC050786 TaxID=3154840 RepID=UPI0033FF4093